MNLHAILCWYDESPTWLAGCVSSLTRVGVSSVIAVDGRYPHYAPHQPAYSRLDQVDAITSAAHGAGMEILLHQPRVPMLEPDKRRLAFRLLNAVAKAHTDWVLVIDADELVVEGMPTVPEELDNLPESTHTARATLATPIDPYATPGADNNVNEKTLEIHQKLPVPSNFLSAQSRFFRVLDQMDCAGTHFNYTGLDRHGREVRLRPDIGSKLDGTIETDIAHLDTRVVIEHRKNHRTAERRSEKVAYYTTRDELGLER